MTKTQITIMKRKRNFIMSFINDIRIVGELIEDASIKKGTNGRDFAILKIKTGRPYRKEKGTEWDFQNLHNFML